MRSGTGMGWSRMGAAPGELTMVTLGKGCQELSERQELQQTWGKAVPWQGRGKAEHPRNRRWWQLWDAKEGQGLGPA